jgi:uncharacterized SAM-binding protein YcdF (DUF218 family)
MIKLFIWIGGIVAVFLAIVFGLSVFLSPDNLKNCDNVPSAQTHCDMADVIVAISGGDTAARTQKAIDLYKNGWAQHLIFSGAAADPSSPSNAEQMREIALRNGVPDSAIALDQTSENTAENAKNVAKILLKNNWTNVILVSETYHLRRAGMVFVAADPVAKIRTTAAQTDRGWWLTPRGWALEMTEIGGIIKFWIGREKA